MNLHICTLYEGNYHLGAGALANSLHASGFKGTLWIGYRGALAPWASGSTTAADKNHQTFTLPNGMRAVFVPLATQIHLTYYKADFLLRVFDELAPEADAAIYLDPDIVVKCPLEIFSRWLDDGIALVEDVNAYMPARHPTRLGWTRLLEAEKVSVRSIDRYYNAGFLGLPRKHREFLKIWNDRIEFARRHAGSTETMKMGGPTDLFHTPDQDALNIALMSADFPINGAGAEAMDFASGGHFLSHAIGTPKPWQGKFIRRALAGYSPSAAAKAYLAYARSPIPVLSSGEHFSLLLRLRLASLISRFYRRS